MGACALPTSSPQMWGQDAWPPCPRRDPPVVFVLIFLNKRCYPCHSYFLRLWLGLDSVEPEGVLAGGAKPGR